MTAGEHARLLGLFFWIYAGFQIVVTLVSCVLMVFWMGIMVPNMVQVEGSQPLPEAFFGLMTLFVVTAAVFTVLFAIPNIVAGFGLRNGKSWTKVWAIIGCCLAVLSVPIGTALGVYGFWFIFGEFGKEYFDGGAERAFPPPPPQDWK